MTALDRKPWGQRPAYHEQVSRALVYIRLGYSAQRLSELFGVPVKTCQKLKDRFG